MPDPNRALVAGEADIFDKAAFDARLDALSADGFPQRSEIIPVLQDALAQGRAVIADALKSRPMQSREAIRSYAWLTDQIVMTVLEIAQRQHPNPTPTEGERIAIFAVGGYGRGEMAPFSDVDLLFLMPWKQTPWAESLIEAMLYIFWDLHLKIGHASRTIKDCLRLAKDDITIRTALLEHRWLAGDADLAAEFDTRLRRDLFKGTGADFIEAKLEERTNRHKKQGGQRYMVEPNVKEGKGGLRDLQTLFWIGKYLYDVRDAADLVERGLFSADEFARFQAAETFLHAVRCQMHLISDRAVEQLTFDVQVEVADRMGYQDRAGRRAVEHFMQDYFRHATAVGELTRIFLTQLEAAHVKSAPSLVTFFKRRRKLPAGYQVKNNRLKVTGEKTFLKDPLNLLRVFDEALRTGHLLHPDTMRLIAANLHRIDDDMRQSKEANRIFLDMLLKRGNPERVLRRMNELGALGAFIPEFAHIVAMMQFNMYHSFTVDEHTIQCISTLAQIERGELVEELPIASRVLKEGVNRKVLYVSLLLHDIGKGRPEDHSVIGAQIARRLAPRLGLNKSESETVEWLVRYHLLMSDMAQKRDLSEPRTIRDFAKAVKTKARLDLLTVLTVCDIRGVGPGVWNNWKAELLRGLYRQTATALESGLEAVNRETAEAEAKQALREALSDWSAADLRAETSRHYGPYWQGMPTDAHTAFAGLLRDIGTGDIRVVADADEDRDATRVLFAIADHPGIFSRLTGALSLVGANIVDARTYTTSDGFATAAFWVQDAEGRPFEADRLPRLRRTIEQTLKGEIRPRESFADKDKLKKRERPFEVKTSISFDNEGSDIYTMIEVDTRDRPGLLYDLSRTLHEASINIGAAVIATYGEQAVDTFYVKDLFGLKLHSATRREALEKRLRAAIARVESRSRA